MKNIELLTKVFEGELYTERWRYVKNYKGYYKISDFGRLQSIDRYVKHSKGGLKIVKGQLLSGSLAVGYLKYELSKKGITKTKKAHIMVAESFLGHINSGNTKGLIVDHIDNDQLNNFFKNLQLITIRKNTTKDAHKLSFSSKYPGVYWRKDRSKWVSMITINGKTIKLCSTDNERYAAEIYNLATRRLHRYNGNSSEFRNLLTTMV